MTSLPSLLGAALATPDLSAYLTKGKSTGSGVALIVNEAYTWALLVGGLLLIIAAIALIKVMNSRVKFFALEYGKGRLRILFPYLLLSTLLVIVGGAATWIGWEAKGYSVTLDPTGLTERHHSDVTRYSWSQVESASERVKSTEFWINFVQGTKACRVTFQQRYIGETLQDRAIQLTETGLIGTTARRVQAAQP